MLRLSEPSRDIAIGTLILVVGACVLAFANLPTRVSVVETQVDGVKDSVRSMDGKLDKILERLPR